MKIFLMNRFNIAISLDNDFEKFWKKVKNHIDNVSVFNEFYFEKVKTLDNQTAYVSNSKCKYRNDFQDCNNSDALKSRSQKCKREQ